MSKDITMFNFLLLFFPRMRFFFLCAYVCEEGEKERKKDRNVQFFKFFLKEFLPSFSVENY